MTTKIKFLKPGEWSDKCVFMSFKNVINWGSNEPQLLSIYWMLMWFCRWRFIFIGKRCFIRWWRRFNIYLQSASFIEFTITTWTSSDPQLSRSNFILSRKLPNIGACWWNWIRKEYSGTTGKKIFLLEYLFFGGRFCVLKNIWVQWHKHKTNTTTINVVCRSVSA